VQKLAHYRKSCPALQTGKMTRYLPQDGIYVYFRHDENKTVMVILSQNEQPKAILTKRFVEQLQGFSSGKNVLDDAVIPDISYLKVPPMSVQVIELQ